VSVPGRRIFRDSALEAYRRRTNKDVVPRLVTGPIAACFWLLLAMLVGAALLAWAVRVPAYVPASGKLERDTRAVLFVPPDEAARVRPGQPVRGQIGSSGRYVRGAVERVATDVVGPDLARARYRFADASDVVMQPSIPVAVRLAEDLPRRAYAGSRLTAQVEVGSERLLALLPGLGELFGGGS
jgi:hypothetical protein